MKTNDQDLTKAQETLCNDAENAVRLYLATATVALIIIIALLVLAL